RAGELDVVLVEAQGLELDVGVWREVVAEGEIDVLRAVTGRQVEAGPGLVVVARLEVITDAQAPGVGAAPEGLAAAPLRAVGFVIDAGALVAFPAVLVAGRVLGVDVEEREARAVANAVRPLDDDDVLDAAGVDLAADGVEVLAGGEE